MAGFFGLFNYDKEGPGVSKNVKKRTLVVFFETFFRNFWKFTPINLIYILISLPIFTNGLANVGITHVARNTARDKHSFGLSDFFETIKKNFKQSLIAGIINTVITAFLLFDIWFFYKSEKTIPFSIILAILFVFIMLNYYLWTLIITFKFSLKQAYKNSLKFVFINFKCNLLCLLINKLILVISIIILFISNNFWLPILLSELLLFVTIYPAFNALLIQFCTFPSIKKHIIDPYYEMHPDEDIEKRKNLGIEVETKKQEPNNNSEL